MKKIISYFLVLTGVLAGFCAVNAGAAIFALDSNPSFEFNMGPDSSIDTSGTNDVLKMHAVVNPNLDDVIFNIEAGQSQSFYFATIGTTESWINRDDIEPGAVTAFVDFENPDLIPQDVAIDGESVGFRSLWYFSQGWNLTWDDPIDIALNGLDFSVQLSDVGYSSWFWQGPDGTADIYATVTLNAVPIPPTIILLGSGVLVLLRVSRRRKNL